MRNPRAKRTRTSKRRKPIMTSKAELKKQAAYQEFWSDPCWQEPLK